MKQKAIMIRRLVVVVVIVAPLQLSVSQQQYSAELLGS